MYYSRLLRGYNNSSDGRMARASASGDVDVVLITSRVKPITLKLVFTASLFDALHKKGQSGKQTGKFTYCVVAKSTMRNSPILV